MNDISWNIITTATAGSNYFRNLDFPICSFCCDTHEWRENIYRNGSPRPRKKEKEKVNKDAKGGRETVMAGGGSLGNAHLEDG